MFNWFKYSDEILKSSLTKAVILLSVTLIFAITLGIILSHLNNMEEIEVLLESQRPSLPSVLLDRNGEVITRFYSDEKRDLVTLDMVPEYLVQGLIIWEDNKFYQHKGFNLWAIIRAAINNMIGKPVSGASTLSQQLARTLFLTHQFTWMRKIKELWIAIQLEKKYTKNEILTLYLNHVPLGYGTNGVGAAARFYFDKDIKDLSFAEAASIITIISNPTYYSFIRFPKNHKVKQRQVIKRMVKKGAISEIEAENSFNEFWLMWQSSAHTSRGAFFNREDEAPFFSDWVLNHIEKELPNIDVFRDGLTIHSTLDLKWNKLAEELLLEVLDRQQRIFEKEQLRVYDFVQNVFIDSLALMSESFTLSNIQVNENREIIRGITDYNKDINPGLNLTSQILGLNLVNTLTNIMFDKSEVSKGLLSQVQGAFIVLENETGQILTMIGGKKFDPNHRFNYAMQSRRQPGSAFKPFFYSAALDTKTFTPATIIMDAPHVFTFDSDDPDDWYTPANYGARFHGKVNVRKALRRSLNIPACKVFYTIGFNNDYKVPIDRAALLLGINSQKEIDRRFKPEISTALGTGSVSPVEMASAFSVFANLGKRKIPNTIVYIEDRDGRIIYDPWKELQKYFRENNRRLQIISRENASIITSILKESIESPDGTLARTRMNMLNDEKEFPPVEFAAKTGTTQNWSDAWVIGFSPIITAAGWVGFNKYGLSLGYEQPGARVVGPVWMEYMRQFHLNNEPAAFQMSEKVISLEVCKESGLLPSKYCEPEDLYTEYFIKGTEPKVECNYCELNKTRYEDNLEHVEDVYDKYFDKFDVSDILPDIKINVDKSILNEFRSDESDMDIEEELIKIDLFTDEEKDDYFDDLTDDEVITNEEPTIDQTNDAVSSENNEKEVTQTLSDATSDN